MNRILLALAFLLAAGLAGSVHAAEARASLDRFTSGLSGLQGQFRQQVYDASGRIRETSSGEVALSAPRLFRWEYQEPYPQLIIADGTRVWVYDPDLEQVTVRPQGDEEQNSPLAALVDPSILDRDFLLREAGSRDGLQWLAIAPRRETDAGFQSAELGFRDGALVQMDVLDALGQLTVIEFSGWRKNPAFAAGTFKFDPPQGVDVVGDI